MIITYDKRDESVKMIAEAPNKYDNPNWVDVDYTPTAAEQTHLQAGDIVSYVNGVLSFQPNPITLEITRKTTIEGLKTQLQSAPDLPTIKSLLATLLDNLV